MVATYTPWEEPFKRIAEWIEQARQHPAIVEPTAMSLATVDANGQPSIRTILLKGLDNRGLTFYTNSESQKGTELKQNPKACLNFYWMPLGRQIRVAGTTEVVTEAESDAYFASRRRGSQIGAWASQQSRPLDSFTQLQQKVAELELFYQDKEIPRPPHWYGWRLLPNSIEFWQEGEYRLHQRELYQQSDAGWHKILLYP